MSYRPEIKINAQGGTNDFPLDAETVAGHSVGFVDLSSEAGESGTLTTAQYKEVQKDYCIIKYKGHIFYKEYVANPYSFRDMYQVVSKASNSDWRLWNTYLTVFTDKTWIYHSTDDTVFTETQVNTLLGNKQDTLVSGTNIKTISGTSLLGSGNIGAVRYDQAQSLTSSQKSQVRENLDIPGLSSVNEFTNDNDFQDTVYVDFDSLKDNGRDGYPSANDVFKPDFVNSEYQKTLNKLNINNPVNMYAINYSVTGDNLTISVSNSSWANIEYLIEPNKQYTLTFTANNSGKVVWATSETDLYNVDFSSGSFSVTFTSTKNYLRFYASWGSNLTKTIKLSNIMLNEGSTALPYAEYNGAIVHQKTTDKLMYNLGVYDRYVDNGDGTITITRQTGYLDRANFEWNSDLNIWRALVYLDLSGGNFVSNIDIPWSYDWAGGYNHYYTESGNTNFFVLSSDVDKVIIQYKLANSYTEKAIKDEIFTSSKTNEVVYDGYTSKTFNAGNEIELLSFTLEANHTYLVNGYVDLNISSSDIMNCSVEVFNGSSRTEQFNCRTTASNGGGSNATYILSPKTYAPIIKLKSYNYTGQNNAPVRGRLQILKLK